MTQPQQLDLALDPAPAQADGGVAHIDLGHDAWVSYQRGWLSAEEADAIFAQLMAELDWQQRPIKVFGKEVMQPRLIAWAGEHPYRYSGQTLEVAPYTPTLLRLVQAASAVAGVEFNHVLLNRYRDGRDNMGLHADDEWELGKDPTIAALSLGTTRRFDIVRKGKGSKRKRKSIPLEHGSMLIMGGTIQHRFWHGVPKQVSLQTERINVTFRRLLGPPGCRSRRPPEATEPPPVDKP